MVLHFKKHSLSITINCNMKKKTILSGFSEFVFLEATYFKHSNEVSNFIGSSINIIVGVQFTSYLHR